MISPGDARHGRPPARSSRARARVRRSAKVESERRGTVAAVAASTSPSLRAPAVEAGRSAPPVPEVPAAEVPAAAAPAPEPAWPSSEPVGATGPPSGPDRPAGPVFDPVEPAMSAADGGATMTATLERPPADETPPGKARSPLRNAVEWVVIIGAALLAAVGIKTYLIQAFFIPSASMEHTLNISDRVLVNKLSYRLHDVRRGDIVVFERPPNDTGQIRDLIKRVVGLSGETVEGRDGTVYVDGRPLAEPYLERGVTTTDFTPTRIPDGFIWVMGDNRGNSSDSRVFGAVDESTIIGRAFVRVWPLTAIGLL